MIRRWCLERQAMVVLPWVLLLLGSSRQLSIAASSTTTDNTMKDPWSRHGDWRPPRAKCSIYLAQTSIREAGPTQMGIYTTRPLADGASVLAPGLMDGPSVPVYDPNPAHSWTFRYTYWWDNGASDPTLMAAYDAFDIQNTFGALPNTHCILSTIDVVYPGVDYDDARVDRFRNAGAGAFSYNMGREIISVGRNVEAGEELFLEYVDCEDPPEDMDPLWQWALHIPLRQDFLRAAQLVRQQWQSGRMPDFTRENDLVQRLLSHITMNITADIMDTPSHSERDLTEIAIRIARANLQRRSVEWIEDNGICVENLVALPSTLPQAGLGGVAQFSISKGDMVVPAPLLHVHRTEGMPVYDFRNPDTRIGTQLMLNYCLSHEESDVLLFPITNAIIVNHCSNRSAVFAKYCPDGPNAVYQWSSGWDPREEDWRNLTVSELMERESRGLSMEVVALRDIEPGEEVFVDYGEAWEEAWSAHVANWKPPHKDVHVSSWITAKEANQLREIPAELMAGDLRNEVDHPYLLVGCVYHASKEPDYKKQIYRRPNPDWENLSDKEILQLYSTSGDTYRDFDYSMHDDRSHWPCSILQKQSDDGDDYIVRMHTPWWREREMPWDANGVPRLLEHYPREAIHFFAGPYETDQQLPGVFRHSIGIPDEMFPQHWKNLKQQEQQRQQDAEVTSYGEVNVIDDS